MRPTVAFVTVTAALAAALAVSVVAAAASARPAASAVAADTAAPPSPLDGLAWLAGCWAAERGEAGSGEVWMAPAGGAMLGIGRTVRDGRTVDHEFMQIRTGADGRLVFIARPSGQRETAFAQMPSTGSEGSDMVVFENPAHDFPQRVSYQRLPGERLLARIEGQRHGALRGIDFPMRRSRCEQTSR